MNPADSPDTVARQKVSVKHMPGGSTVWTAGARAPGAWDRGLRSLVGRGRRAAGTGAGLSRGWAVDRGWCVRRKDPVRTINGQAAHRCRVGDMAAAGTVWSRPPSPARQLEPET